MGERKGQNKYYPPDFDPQKHKSLDAYHGSHPLRERAKKIKEGILVIRFEMPYNMWCGGCKIHIAQSVRYNAEKSKVGMYYTTPIYQFRMKCHLCPNYIVIKTDPAAHDYVIVEGGRRKEQRWDPKENEQIVPEDKATQKKLFADAMYKLEHGGEDAAKLKQAKPAIAHIQVINERAKDDYLINKLARQQFREEKSALLALEERDKALLEKSSLAGFVQLVDEHADDQRLAQLLKFSTVKSFDEKQIETRKEIESRPMFASTVSAEPSVSSSPVSKSQELANDLRKRIIKAKAAAKVSPFVAATSQKSRPDFGIVRKVKKDSKPGSPCRKAGMKPEKTVVAGKPQSELSVGHETMDISTPDTRIDRPVPTAQPESKPETVTQTSDIHSSSSGDDQTSILHRTSSTKSDKDLQDETIANNALHSLIAYDDSSSNSSSES